MDASTTTLSPSEVQHVSTETPRHADVESPVLEAHRVPAIRSWQYVTSLTRSAAPLCIADMTAVFLSLLIATFAGESLGMLLHPGRMLPSLFVAAVLACGFSGLYPGVGLSAIVEFRKLMLAAGMLAACIGLLSLASGGGNVPLLLFAIGGTAWVILATMLRGLARDLCKDQAWWLQPVLIFGCGGPAKRIEAFLRSEPRVGLRPLGMLDSPHRYWAASEWYSGENGHQENGHQENGHQENGRDAYLGPADRAGTVALEHRVFWGIVAMPDRPPAQVTSLLQRHVTMLPRLFIIPEISGTSGLWKTGQECGPLGLPLRTGLLLPGPQFLKRCVDLLLIAAMSIFLAPVVLLLCVLIKLTSPGPAFYRQERIGRFHRRFGAWKFRTMVQNADEVLQNHLEEHPHLREEWEQTHKLRQDPRITKIGRFLRKTSLDELPQLWNVLTGEMSLVGPRPIVEAEIEKYGDVFDLYLQVRPGLTGLWQISGRNNTTYDERVEFDMCYVCNWSVMLDLLILGRTLPVVVRGDGAY